MSTHNISFSYKKEKLPIIILSLPLWDIFKGLKNEFETAVVDETSVFKPPQFYCIQLWHKIFLEHVSLTCLNKPACM